MKFIVSTISTKKVLNTGQTFLTTKGLRKPKYVWVGCDIEGLTHYEQTKKGLIKGIDRSNRLLAKGII